MVDNTDAAVTIPFAISLFEPGKCTPPGQFYYNSTTGFLRRCSSVNVWSDHVVGALHDPTGLFWDAVNNRLGIGAVPLTDFMVKKNVPGGDVRGQVQNLATTVGSNAIMSTSVQGAAGGSPFFRTTAAGVQDWSFGQDALDSQKFKIGAGSEPWVNTFVTILKTGQIGFGMDPVPGVRIDVSGSIRTDSGLIGESVNLGGGALTIDPTNGIITGLKTPASATAAGFQGTIRWDANFIYICVADNVWKRIAITTW